MKSNNKNDIKSIISDLEYDKFIINTKCNGYRLWPIARVAIHLQNSKTYSSNRVKIKNKKSLLLKDLFKSIYSTPTLFKGIEKVYTGFSSTCTFHNGYLINKYFDLLMDDSASNSLYLNGSDSFDKYYKRFRHFNYKIYILIISQFTFFGETKRAINNYSKIVSEKLESKGLSIDQFDAILSEKIRTVNASYYFFLRLLNLFKPKEIWVSCYYSAEMMGLIIAADKLSIPTIDLQHGAQGDNHLAYNSWTNLPVRGFEALPNFFYTWDKYSADRINSWAHKTTKHSAVEFGNPWVKGWRDNRFEQSNIDWPENLILYTLQPVKDPLESYILNAIQQTYDKFDWWIRIHPRQLDQREQIVNRLKKYKVYDKVNVDDATDLPLPEILLNTKIHITKFSGSAIEAFEFKVPSLIIDSRGIDCFSEYISNEDYMYAEIVKDTDALVKAINNIQFSKNN